MFLRLTSIALFLGLLIPARSSMNLKINSYPDKATVYLNNGKERKKLGVTPLEIPSQELGSASSYNILIEKEGFQVESVLLERRTMKARAEIYANLKKLQNQESNGRNVASEEVGEQQRQLASIQTLLLKNNYQQAENQAQTFVNQHPFSPVGWNLLGNSYLLQNRNSEALKAYRKAYEYDPGNQDTEKLIKFLQQKPLRRER